MSTHIYIYRYTHTHTLYIYNLKIVFGLFNNLIISREKKYNDCNDYIVYLTINI